MRALWFVCLLILPTLAQAQVPLERFNAERFSPAPGPGNYFATEGARLRGHGLFGAGLTIDYGHRPFVLLNATCADESGTNCSVTDERAVLVSYQLQFNLYASLVLWDRLQVGLNLPMILADGDGFSEVVRGEPVSIAGGQSFTVSDPMLSLKLRFLGDGNDGFFLGASAFGSFPIGQLMSEDAFNGGSSVKVGGQLIAQLIAGGFHLSANVGGFWQDSATLFSTEVGPQLTYRAALGYDVTPLLLVFGEVDGAAGFTGQLDEYPLEGRLGARLRVGDVAISLGGGAGIISGVGVPPFRVIAGVAYDPRRGDADRDGVDDADDQCPTEAEDVDGWLDTDGCPEADNDGDGRADGDDPCPIDAEDMDNFEDEDGCPDTDNDQDGVRDGFDSCPNEVEDMDGDRDEDGCPDDDTDRDGIVDAQDQCPTDAEDADGFGDEDGCPEVDFDGDGMPDDGDQCPDQPEMVNGITDDDGCPEEDQDGDGVPNDVDRCPDRAETLNGQADEDGCPDGTALVQQTGDRIVLLQQIQFATSRATIRGRVSNQILQAVASILLRNPQFQRVRIEGHTDNRGDEAANTRLSQQRAEAVQAALVRLGVDVSRLSSQGFGPARPVGDNNTNEGREQNRRVEFIIEPVRPVAPPAPTTEEPVAEEAPAAPPAAPAEEVMDFTVEQ